MNKQNELIRSLRQQLEATERELANQKWLLEQYLKSPSWRLTAPIRWLAKQLRALRDAILGASPTVGAVGEAQGLQRAASSNDRPGAHRAALQQDETTPELESSLEMKEFFTELSRVQLQ